ncbi:glycerate kinase type-2 family protein [Photobacterium atrarenae]|uniref:Glycerate kinase n=1 Tax=Photobacterium atrarenae TaxID=865757 RepID=A0ABY5GLR3_9GAMM|nr:glycerate kinase [Photobacterium atrarenae]UTV29680.1 glycerate kinase [Photobacterium atrarenae]
MDIDAKHVLRTLFDSAVKQALPQGHMASFLPEDLFTQARQKGGRTVIIGAGKAAASMAQELERIWQYETAKQASIQPELTDSTKIPELEGLVVTRYGHTVSCEMIEVIEASHPVPDEMGMAVGERVLELAAGLSEADTLICLISGGGSALLSLPAPGISLAEKQALNKALLRSGAAIDEMNCVRKHLSALKGGRLAKLAYPAQVITLAISDVPGDDLSVIASGPTVPDSTTRFDALAVLERYQIDVPPAAHQWLNQPASETVKPDDPCWTRCQNHLIATPQMALEAAAAEAQGMGIPAYILSDCVEGEARDVAKVHAALARQVVTHQQPFQAPCVLISGGETTVTVKGEGRGGRNCEFLLSLLNELKGQPRVFAIAADTDGIDGVEDNAGAWITPETWAQAQSKGLKAQDYLDNNNSYAFFEQTDSLVFTGPTLTNVNDFRALLIL